MEFFSFDRYEQLIVVDYYTKMSPSQCNSAKTVGVLKELFAKHRILEVIRLDNGSQFRSFLFTKFVKEWDIDYIISST